SNVSISGNGRPVLRQYSPTEVVNLDLPFARPSCPLKAEVEAADPREEAPEDGHVTAPPRRRPPASQGSVSSANTFSSIWTSRIIFQNSFASSPFNSCAAVKS